MKRIILFALTFLVGVVLAGCAPKTYQAMEAASVCDESNDKKDIQLSGYLSDSVTVMCSNYGGRMDCTFKLSQQPGEKDGIRVSIEQGDSANQVEELARNYKKEDVKIRDNSGSLVTFADKVKVSGTMSVGPKSPSGQACFLTVDMIEK